MSELAAARKSSKDNGYTLQPSVIETLDPINVSAGVSGADPGEFVGFGRTPYPSEIKKFFEAILAGRR